jgi:hypothetical protein
MTKLIHPYSLQAFPTEKILKEFKPVRGCHVHGQIELPNGQNELLQVSLANHIRDQLAWKAPAVEADLTPLIEAIAVQMGYDPALMAQGKGETGVPEHSWIPYMSDDRSALLVRWLTGKGQLLLGIENDLTSLTLALLADEGGLAAFSKAYDVVIDIAAPAAEPKYVEVPVGDTVQKVQTSVGRYRNYFGQLITVCLPADRQLNEIRRQDLARLGAGVPLVLATAEEIRSASEPWTAAPPLEPNGLRIHYQGEQTDFGSDEPLPRALIEVIGKRSVDDAWLALAGRSEAKAYQSVDMEAENERICRESLDVELSERGLKLREQLRFFPRMAALAGAKWSPKLQSISPEVNRTPAESLRGTGPFVKMTAGDLGKSGDLLEKLFQELDQVVCTPVHQQRNIQTRLRIKGECHLPPLAKQYEDGALECCRRVDIARPYFSTHRGLPVRVDKRLIVWREGDAEALAADYFHLPETGDVHLANLVRVPVPAR